MTAERKQGDRMRCVDPWGAILEHYDGDWHIVGQVGLAPIGDGHHESALADDKDQAQDTTVVAD